MILREPRPVLGLVPLPLGPWTCPPREVVERGVPATAGFRVNTAPGSRKGGTRTGAAYTTYDRTIASGGTLLQWRVAFSTSPKQCIQIYSDDVWAGRRVVSPVPAPWPVLIERPHPESLLVHAGEDTGLQVEARLGALPQGPIHGSLRTK
jgi:hypothetical protein